MKHLIPIQEAKVGDCIRLDGSGFTLETIQKCKDGYHWKLEGKQHLVGVGGKQYATPRSVTLPQTATLTEACKVCGSSLFPRGGKCGHNA